MFDFNTKLSLVKVAFDEAMLERMIQGSSMGGRLAQDLFDQQSMQASVGPQISNAGRAVRDFMSPITDSAMPYVDSARRAADMGPNMPPLVQGAREGIMSAVDKIKAMLPASKDHFDPSMASPISARPDPETALKMIGLGGGGVLLSALLGKRLGAISKQKQIQQMLQAAAPAMSAPAAPASISSLLAQRGRNMYGAAMGY